MTDNYNGLSPAQDERLAILAEECAEVIQVICKVQRHGYYSKRNSLDWNCETNAQELARELGHVLCAKMRMINNGDIPENLMEDAAKEKETSSLPYLHHQGDPE